MSKKKEELSKFYEFTDLSKYGFKQRFLVKTADLFFSALIYLICRSSKFEVIGAENIDKIKESGQMPIYAYWHNRIFSGLYFFRGQGIFVMTSQSFDGEYTARISQRFGFGAVRGSSTRGGIGGLVEIIRAMKNGAAICFTVDGPKGPKYKVKEGVILIAKKTGNPIFPICTTPKSFFEVKSWDRLQIPLPFTKITVEIGAPIYVPSNADETEIEAKRLELQKALDKLVESGENRRKSIFKT